MKIPKTLLIVASQPGQGNVGEILIDEMLVQLEPGCIAVASILPTLEHPDKSLGTPYNVRFFEHPDERKVRRFNGPLGAIDAMYRRSTRQSPIIRRVVSELQSYVREQDIQQVWAIYNTPSIVDIVTRLQKIAKLPLLSHVWDDMEHICRERHLDGVSRHRTTLRFSKLLRESERTAVICENMARNYSEVYSATCCIVRYGTQDQVEPRGEFTSSNEFRIGFSGGMYSHSAWKVLIQAFEKLDWRVAGKSIRFVVMSGNVQFTTRHPANIDYLGWRSTSEVFHELSQCDLLYLPQAFEEQQRPLTELSFPTKLSAYVGTGRPILIHTPTYGSLAQFCNRHSISTMCNHLSASDLAESINRLAQDIQDYRKAAECVANVGSTVLSRARFIEQLRKFLLPEAKTETPNRGTSIASGVLH